MTFYFYDLETSGINPRKDRIVQFAGQRTTLDLKPIGSPDNIVIRLTEDVLPEPDAVLITGITPQKTRLAGITEAEFLHYFDEQVVTPNTTLVGYNNIRFDDEFMRFGLWRNFYDAYEWHWKDDRSRWDLLDVVRMTRALRPRGIKWPFASDGQPSNRLELLTSINALEHVDVHDALSDVRAIIAVARLLQNKQPKLFQYLFKLRDKKKVAPLVTKGDPLIYTSGRYPSEYQKTTVAVMLAPHPDRGAALMYDLRVDPTPFAAMNPEELAKLWQLRGKDAPYFPIKVLSYNRSPAIAPLSVLDKASAKSLQIDSQLITKHLKTLKSSENFAKNLLEALTIVQPKAQPELVVDEQKVDGLLYDGFVTNADKVKMSVVRAADAQTIKDLLVDFEDERLQKLLPLYKARNYPKSLSQQEKDWWQNFRRQKLLAGDELSLAARYFKRLEELKQQPGLTKADNYLLEELKLYGQSILPAA